MNRARAVGVAAVATAGLVAWLVLGSWALAASSAPTGNKAAIVLYHRSEAAMAAYQGLAFSGGGTSYTIDHAIPGFAWGATPAGYKRASDDVSVIQRGGVVVEEVDMLSAPGEPSLVIWTAGATRWVVQLQRPGACVWAVPAKGGGMFATVGQPFVEPDGSTFAALQRSGRVEIVRSTYPDQAATAQETDSINAVSGLWQSSTTVYRGDPRGVFATSMSAFRYTRAKPLVPLPPARRCH
jgi:hypothetical protein